MADGADDSLSPLITNYDADQLVDNETSRLEVDHQTPKRSVTIEHGNEEQSTAGGHFAKVTTSSRRSVTSTWLISSARHCASEFVATTIFVFLGTTSVATGNSLLVALVHGLTITLLVVAFADIGGAHINPVVTLAAVLTTDSKRWIICVFCVILQLFGGIAGAALTRGVLSYLPHGASGSNITVYESIKGGSHTLADGVTDGQGIMMEAALTFVLVEVVLLVATDRTWHHRQLALAVGFAVFADIAVSANITGGSMNPARSFGPAIVVSDLDVGVWTHHYVYWVGPVIGTLIAVVVFRLIFGGALRKTSIELQQLDIDAYSELLLAN